MREMLQRAARSEPPPVLPAFAHMQRYWDPESSHWTVKILPGEYYVTRND